MFANIVESVYRSGQQAERLAALAEFDALGSQQPGLQRAIRIDTGGGRILAVTLWENEATLEAARLVTVPASERLLGPLRVAPPQRLGSGEVVRDSSTPGATYALLAAVTYAPGQQEAGLAQADEYRALVDAQPGARGAIFIDVGAGRQLVLRLWASEAEQQASSATLRATFDRLVAPWQSAPLQWLGAGAIIRDTDARSAATG